MYAANHLQAYMDLLSFDGTNPDGTTAKALSKGYLRLFSAILKVARTERHKNRFRYGELYNLNYYLEVKEKDRTYYEFYSLPRTEETRWLQGNILYMFKT